MKKRLFAVVFILVLTCALFVVPLSASALVLSVDGDDLYVLDGTYVFNDALSGSASSVSVDFSDNADNSYFGFRFSYGMIFYVQSASSTLAYVSGSFTSAVYKQLTFHGQIVPEDFYNWFVSNTTLLTYNAGISDAVYGVFLGHYITGTIDYMSLSSGLVNKSVTITKDDYVQGALDFASLNFLSVLRIYGNYYASSGYDIERADLTVHFAVPFQFGSPDFYFSGSSDVLDIIFYDTEGHAYAASRGSSSQRALLSIDVNDSSMPFIDSVYIHFGRAGDTLDCTLFAPSSEYGAGYSLGYNDGSEAGQNIGFQIGFQSGRDYGYRDGYQAGFASSLSTSEPMTIYGSIFSTIGSWFNIQLFPGLSIGLIVGIPLVLGVVLVVLKLVRG